MTRYYHLTSRWVGIPGGNVDEQWGDGGRKERSVAEVNFSWTLYIFLTLILSATGSLSCLSVPQRVHLFLHVCRPVWFIPFEFPPGYAD